MDSQSSPCSGFITKDPNDHNRICAGFRQCSSKKGVEGMPHPWDVPLELRCALDDQLTSWSTDPEYLFNVSFWRPVPYDPARPWRESDGMWYQLLSLDACNKTDTHGRQHCDAGGQLGMWKSPYLRGPKANWKMVGPVFSSNKTVLAGGHLAKEFVTIDYIGMLEGDPAPAKDGVSGTRIFLNNVGGNGGGNGCCSGTTSYFPVVQDSPGGSFRQVAPQGMVDWGAFTFNTSATAPGLTGVDLLIGTASRGLSMARTLGSETSDQVTKPGRRVLIGWTGPSDFLVHVVSHVDASAQSLPRDLSLAPDKSLLQRFVPELQILRRGFQTGKRATVAGLQAEVFVTFPSTCVGNDRGGNPCGLHLDSYGKLLLDQTKRLVTLDLMAANNSLVRAGPLPPPTIHGGIEVHLYIDHQIIELLVNNATSIVAYWSPPAELNSSLELSIAGDGSLNVWELATANNNTKH